MNKQRVSKHCNPNKYIVTDRNATKKEKPNAVTATNRHVDKAEITAFLFCRQKKVYVEKGLQDLIPKDRVHVSIRCDTYTMNEARGHRFTRATHPLNAS